MLRRLRPLVLLASVALTAWPGAGRAESPLVPGAAQPAEPALRLGPPSDGAHYGRAALEMLGVLAIGVGQYWLSAGANHRDWDFPRLSRRFDGESVRFDNNTHVTNNLLHPLAGSAYSGLSRANGLSVGESVLYAQLSSAIWEWGLEWREKVSINDMVATTSAGTAAGEFFVQLAAYLNSAPDGGAVVQQAAAATLGFPVWVHDRLDRRSADPSPPKDRLGFSSAYHHRFTLDLHNAWLDDAAERQEQLRGVRLAAQLASVPGFLGPETFARPFAGGDFTEAALELEFDGSGLRNVDVEFDAVLAGYYAQWASPRVLGLIAGVGTGLEFVDRTSLGHGDQYALAHFVGPSLALFRKGEIFSWALASRLYGDFAPIRSLAWPRVYAADPGATYKSTLERDYQYNLGFSNRSYAELRVHSLILSVEYSWGRYRSIEGLDRFQEQITRDLEGSEALDERRLMVALEPPGAPLRAYAGVERFSHVSHLGGFVGARLERRFIAGMGLAF
jgi:hypothetical protein